MPDEKLARTSRAEQTTGDNNYRNEFARREEIAYQIMGLYLQRKRTLDRGASVIDMRRGRSGGGAASPVLGDLHCWVLDIERLLKSLGQKRVVLMVARLRPRPMGWERIGIQFRMAYQDAKRLYREAVTMFTDELEQRGITEDYKR